MINIYSVIDYDGRFIGVYKTDKTLEEKKEELINSLLLNKKPLSLIQSLDNNKNYSFDLQLVKRVTEVDCEVEFNRIVQEYIVIKKDELSEIINPKVINFKRLEFNDNWITFSRPTLCTNKQNPILVEVSQLINLELDDAIDIIKELSSFIIGNMNKKICTRIPSVGAFKIKKSLAVEHLNNAEYGTSNYRRRKQFRDRQDLDKINSCIQQVNNEEKEE